MKKVITAIGNPYLNKKIKELEDYDVLVRDIQYQEGVIDIIKLYKKIDLLLISTEIIENDIETFIKEIKKLSSAEIVIFFNEEKNIDIALLNSNNIYKYFLNDENGYKEFLYSINNNQNIIDKLKENTNELKQNILEEQKLKKSKNLKNNLKQKEKDKFEKINLKKNKVILIAGEGDVGKTTFLLLFLKYIKEQGLNVLVIDTCKNDSSINLILGNYIKNINYLKINNEYKDKHIFNIHKNIENLKEEYDLILIDTKFSKNDSHKNILFSCDDILFLIEPNILEINKAKNILEIYEKDYEVSKNKIKIIFNKYDKNHICKEILEEIFIDYEILEIINYSSEYSLFIHKNLNVNINENKFKNIYRKILF